MAETLGNTNTIWWTCEQAAMKSCDIKSQRVKVIEFEAGESGQHCNILKIRPEKM